VYAAPEWLTGSPGSTVERHGDLIASKRHPRPLTVAMLAPPWIAIPPVGYGGVEEVVAALTDALVAGGHRVTLFCAPGSRSSATTVPLLDETHPNEIERALHEADHVSRAFAAIDLARQQGRPFDVVHDHCGFTAVAMADRLQTPLLHTLHGPFTPQTGAFFAHHAEKAWFAGISESQLASGPANLRSVGAIANPIDAAKWPFRPSHDDYLLWIGRITPDKGPHRAIAVARAAGANLVLAGIVQPGQREFFQREIEPHIDGHSVRFVGEVGGAQKRRLFAGARALLLPIRWPEPFGMVIVESLVCGTPVLAFDEGAASELIQHGKTGLIVRDEADMVRGLADLEQIDPYSCRRWVVDHCSADIVAAAYEAAYRTVIAAGAEPALTITQSHLAGATIA